MEEFTTKKNLQNLSGDSLKSGTKTVRNQNPSRNMALENDGAYFEKAGALTTLATIENLLQKGKIFTGLKGAVDFEKGFEYKLLKRIQIDGLCTLSKLSKECFEAKSVDLDEAFYKKLHISCSAFISAHRVLSFQQKYCIFECGSRPN